MWWWTFGFRNTYEQRGRTQRIASPTLEYLHMRTAFFQGSGQLNIFFFHRLLYDCWTWQSTWHSIGDAKFPHVDSSENAFGGGRYGSVPESLQSWPMICMIFVSHSKRMLEQYAEVEHGSLIYPFHFIFQYSALVCHTEGFVKWITHKYTLK